MNLIYFQVEKHKSVVELLKEAEQKLTTMTSITQRSDTDDPDSGVDALDSYMSNLKEQNFDKLERKRTRVSSSYSFFEFNPRMLTENSIYVKIFFFYFLLFLSLSRDEYFCQFTKVCGFIKYKVQFH